MTDNIVRGRFSAKDVQVQALEEDFIPFIRKALQEGRLNICTIVVTLKDPENGDSIAEWDFGNNVVDYNAQIGALESRKQLLVMEMVAGYED